MLLDRGISTWQRRLGILALVAVLVGVVVMWGRQTLPALDLARSPTIRGSEITSYKSWPPAPRLTCCIRSGSWFGRSWRPTPLPSFTACGPALLLVLLHYVWVVRSNVAFEEASVQASQKMAEKLAPVRSGNWQAANRKPAASVRRSTCALPARLPWLALEKPHQRRSGFHLAHLD